MSIGYCTSRIDNEEQLRQAIAQADDCLYRAKDRGKNQIIGQERT
ncbi:diguanylate cyclase domain-containing protein [Lactobacillus nasalidis]|nr:diguanylate cyclase [Lactobacillus nasalidis]